MTKEDTKDNEVPSSIARDSQLSCTLAEYIERRKGTGDNIVGGIVKPTEKEVKDYGISLPTTSSSNDDSKNSSEEKKEKKKKKKSSTTTFDKTLPTTSTVTNYHIGMYGYYRTHYIDGRNYKVEKAYKEKEYTLVDENGRILETFYEIPTESEIRNIHKFIINYQAKVSDEDKMKVLYEVYAQLVPIKETLKKVLFELEYSPITDNRIFAELRLMLKAHKDVASAIKQAYKKYAPPEKKSSDKEEGAATTANISETTSDKEENKSSDKEEIKTSDASSIEESTILI
jgi:hypothetical protein